MICIVYTKKVYTNFGDEMKVEMLIRQVRENRDISLSELSRRTNIAKSHLSNIERNIKEPTISVLVKISLALEVDIKELYKVKE